MVISQKMIENEIRYRGSKPKFQYVFIKLFVKEQRVDGDWSFTILLDKI